MSWLRRRRRSARSRLVTLALTATLATPVAVGIAESPATAATGCAPAATQVALYVNRSYGGTCVNFNVGAYPRTALSGLTDNSVSSLKVGASVVAVVHQDADFGGADNHSWQSFTASDTSLFDNLYPNLQSPPNNGGRIEDSISSMWVMRKGCVPAATQVAVFQEPSYAGACALVGQGSFTTSGRAGLPADWGGSVKVGTSTRVAVWAGAGFTGTSCAYNKATSQAALCIGKGQMSALSVGTDAVPPSLTVQHTVTGQNGWNVNAPVQLSVSAGDTGSGLAGAPTCNDNGVPMTVSGSAPSFSTTAASAGTHVVKCTARDTMGNVANASDTVKVDARAPTFTVTTTAAGAPYTPGTWARADVVVSFVCTDADSGVATADPPPMTVSNEGTAGPFSGTCSDKAGNSVTRTVDSVSVDKSLPVITAERSPEPSPSGWESTDVTVTFACDDAVSGVATLTDPVTITDDGPDQSATGTCADRAGNAAVTTVSDIDIDRDPPVVTASATAGGQPYQGGVWSASDVVVTFTCTDAGSGVASVTPPVTVSAEGDDQSVTGTCTDQVGASSTTTFDGIRIDKTAPAVTASTTAGGDPYQPGTWSDENVTVTFDCVDPLSGVASVTNPKTLTSEGPNQSASGTCTDRAGNATSATASDIDIDKGGPTLTASAKVGSQPYQGGVWSRSDVVVTFTCTDAGSGVASVTPPVTVSSEGDDQSVTGTCTDQLSASSTTTFDHIRIDKTAPVVTASTTAGGDPYQPGTWSDENVTVTFDCSDPLSGVGSVTAPKTLTNEGPNQSASGTCADRAGNASSATASDIDIDKGNPVLTAAATSGGAPYQSGKWVKQSVVVTFTCTDAGSGVASVTPPVTVSANGEAQSVTGTCTDQIGNSTSKAFNGISIDKTSPTVTYTGNQSTYVFGQSISIDCAATDPLSGIASSTCVDIDTSTLAVGSYTYSASATDRAGNTATGSTTILVDYRPALSVGSGPWSDPATWSTGAVPGPNDAVTVRPGDTVTIDAAPTPVAGVTVQHDATLAFAPDASITLESSRNVVVEGTLSMRPSSGDVAHLLRFVSIDERRFQGGGNVVLPNDTGLWVTGAGRLDATGAPKTAWTRLTAPVPAGATSITLPQAPDGWRVGDEIVLAPTEAPSVGNPSWQGFDQRTITGISGATVTFAGGTARAHPVVNGMWGAEVMNISRNVRIEGTPTGRTHVMVTATVPQTISNVALRYTGPRQDSDGDGITSFVLGRYGLHFHMGGDGTRGSTVEGVVVRDGGSHAFVPHMSNGVTFRDTIAYNQLESPYWWDEGTETDDTVWQHTIAALVKSDPVYRGFRLTGYELGRGTGNRLEDSVAVGVQGNVDASGFTWPEPANADPNTWDYTDNIAHNNKVDGIFTWQNTVGRHVVGPFVAYHNGGYGIDHGAYVNPYRYHDALLIDNVSGGINQRALSRGNAGQLTFEGMTVKGGLYAVLLAEHNLPGIQPTMYRDCAFSGQSIAKILVAESRNAGAYDFVNCDLQPSDFRIVSTVPGMLIRVQRPDKTAFQIDASGTATVIPRFEPPDVAPTVSISGPASGTPFTEPADVTITVEAADSDGTIRQVEPFAGSTSLGVVTGGGPYTFTWDDVAAGTYTLTAVATDNDTAKTTSQPVTITVDPAPPPPTPPPTDP